MTVATAKYGNWTTYTGTVEEVSAALNLHNAKADKSFTFSDSSAIIGVVYGG